MPHPHTIHAREQKYHDAIAMGITEERISDLVETFYDHIRNDDMVGPIFNRIITDWPPHLARMKDFWTSIAIESGRFHGNPMIKHLAIPDINRAHFMRWLSLFDEVLPTIFPNACACQFLSDRAARIADSLMTGISIHRDGLPTVRQKNSTKRRNTMLLDESNLAVHSQEFGEPGAMSRTDPASIRVQPEARTFGIPAVIWGTMAASYFVFFTGLALGTGHDGKALFMIAISVLYTLMYFGTAFALNSLGMVDRKKGKNQWTDGKFDTFTGPMTFGSVYGQMLVVPIMFALFGVVIAIVRFAVF